MLKLKSLVMPAVFTVVAALLVVMFLVPDYSIAPKTNQEMAKTSVKIVRNDGESGGSGVIISSERYESKILTNRHVCGVVKNGGLVVGDDFSVAVAYYVMSEDHDLCLITVEKNLKVATRIASSSPEDYSDAAISGHPLLLPNIVTRGHFSGSVVIEVMMELKPCTESDMHGPFGIFCSILGGIPQIRRYQARIVSATIQPGSSGSAVFNSSGEISGLVFAGNGNFGYAMIVPLEYIVNFLNDEVYRLKVEHPKNTVSVMDAQSERRLRSYCSKNDLTGPFTRETCKLHDEQMIFFR